MLSLPASSHRRTTPDPFSSPIHAGLALAGAALVFLGLPAPGRADIHTAKQKGKIPREIVARAPASAAPRAEEIDPGGQVEITLEALGAGTRSVDFDIATRPRHGTLTEFRHAGSKETVVYVHDPASGPGKDEFTYRVQASGLEVSAPARVEIAVRDYPPRLTASPAELDFGAVNVGESARAQVAITNEGGGIATGRFEPPLPWTVDGDTAFRLAAGERQTFRVVFRPQNGRSFSESVRIGDAGVGAQQNSAVHLVGAGLGGPAEPTFAGINGAPPAPLETPAPVALAAPAGAVPGETAGADSSPRRGPGTVPPPTPASSAAAVGGMSGGVSFQPPEVVVNEAGVKSLQEGVHGSTSLEIAWKEPTPRPASYRVELRNLSLDRDDDLVITWVPHPKVTYQRKDGTVRATLSGLPPNTNQTVRVVAVDAGGRFAVPSPTVEIRLDPVHRWWRLSLLQYLVLALIVCGALVARKRLENRRILTQIDRDRAARRKLEMV